LRLIRLILINNKIIIKLEAKLAQILRSSFKKWYEWKIIGKFFYLTYFVLEGKLLS